MANLLEEGIWPCTVLGGSYGEELDQQGKPTGRIKARINIKFDEGPNAGRFGSYEDEVNARSSLYVGRSLKAVGWRGSSLEDVSKDIDAWIAKTGGKSTAEVRHIEIKNGKRYEKWVDAGNPGFPIWDKINSIGRGPRPLAAPSSDALADANEAMRRAMEEDGANPPADDVPHVAVSTDDIPF